MLLVRKRKMFALIVYPVLIHQLSEQVRYPGYPHVGSVHPEKPAASWEPPLLLCVGTAQLDSILPRPSPEINCLSRSVKISATFSFFASIYQDFKQLYVDT